MLRLQLRDDIIWREVDGEIVSLDGDLKNYVSTNASGTILWKCLAEGSTREHLVARLVDAFGIEAEQAEQDVDVFLAELEANGFLQA